MITFLFIFLPRLYRYTAKFWGKMNPIYRFQINMAEATKKVPDWDFCPLFVLIIDLITNHGKRKGSNREHNKQRLIKQALITSTLRFHNGCF